MATLAVAGISSSVAMATANSSVQTAASDAVRGRVMAVYMTVFAGTAPFGALISGAIANHWGIAVSVGFGGLMTMIAAISIAWLQREQHPHAQPMRTAGAD
jgi:MFS family permease